MNPIAIRLLSQQLVCHQFKSPKEVVSHMGAVQAQDYRMMRWAVTMRMKNAPARAFREAYDRGDLIRLHLLRGTWQLVSADDYWWMLNLCAEKSRRVIKGWMKANKVAISDVEMSAVREILVETCKQKVSATKEDFSKALGERGFVMDPHRLSYHIRLSELSGTLCSGCLTPLKATYALTVDRVGESVPMERDTALKLLARRYFQSHAPASLEDFVWWSGLTVSECRKGMKLLGAELRMEKWGNYEFYLHESCRVRGFRSGGCLLLSPFDEFLVGYKSRELSLPSEFSHHAYTNNGIFFPVVLQNGVVCGNWSPWGNDLDMSFFLPVADGFSAEKQWSAFCKLKSDNLTK